ncbi:MAG: hypothetical protein SFX72_08535 [Isosphaeraceae bacterium]|nr:hypothetical protein [Isosphaeraceae bacterium]
MLRFPSHLRSFALAVPLALALAVSPSRADEILVVAPTSTIVSTSESYVYPTSSIVSTSYYLPTSTVVGTSYILPTTSVWRSSPVLLESSYLVPTRRVFLPRTSFRRLRGTVYLTPTYYTAPLSYLAPTTYVSTSRVVASTAWAGDPCCGSSAPISTPAPSSGTVMKATPSNRDEERVERVPTPAVDPETTRTEQRQRPPIVSEPTRPSSERTSGKAPAAAAPSTPTSPFEQRSSTPAPAPAAGSGAGAEKPAATAAPEPKPTPIPATPPVPSEPAAPEGSSLPDIPPPLGAPESSRRTSLRPAFRDVDAGRTAAVRSVLQGRVLASESGEAEEGVAVMLIDRLERFPTRTVRSDAFGRFAVTLPEGDWNVQVTMPGGEMYNVGKGDLTATGGKIFDPSGREISLLTIRR